jgi:transcriptional regulator with XRE-family HTH domain
MTKARIRLRMTQKDVADKVGMYQNHVAKIERAEVSPSWESAQAICAVLGISLDKFAIIKGGEDKVQFGAKN